MRWPRRWRLRVLIEAGRRMKRRWLIVGVVAIGAAAAAVTMATRQPTTADNGSPDTTEPRETAQISRTDLIEEEKLRGTLGYGDSEVIGGTGSGTITGLPEPGTVIKQGESPWQVDGHAGPALFYGDMRLWDECENGVDDGADVPTRTEPDRFASVPTDRGRGLRQAHHGCAQGVAGQRGVQEDRCRQPGDVVVEARPRASRRAARGSR